MSTSVALPESWITKAELAKALGISPRTINYKMAEGMPYLRISSRTVRFKLSDVQKWFGMELPEEVEAEDVILYPPTPAEWVQLRDAQQGCCAICGRETDLCADHDHQTGAVRGLLCRSCNVGIGFLGDTLEGVQRAVSYLNGGVDDSQEREQL